MAAASIIGQGTVVRGNVRGGGSLVIDGRVEGDVSVDGDVTLGEHGAVELEARIGRQAVDPDLAHLRKGGGALGGVEEVAEPVLG